MARPDSPIFTDLFISSLFFNRTPISGYNLRKTLRKVNVIRSPGGTPLVKSKMETGVGITPLLTAALKRKFKVMNLKIMGVFDW